MNFSKRENTRKNKEKFIKPYLDYITIKVNCKFINKINQQTEEEEILGRKLKIIQQERSLCICFPLFSFTSKLTFTCSTLLQLKIT